VAWARRIGLERKLAVALLVAAIASGLTTYSVLTGSFGAAQGHGRTVPILTLIDMIVLLLLGIFLARRLVTLWIQRRRGLAGARLHARMVLLLGLAAMTPTIIVAIFTTLFLNLGIDAWFNERFTTAVYKSNIVANAYMQEHQQRLGESALDMAAALRSGVLLTYSQQQLNRLLWANASARQLDEAVIIDSGRQTLANAGVNLLLAYDLPDLPDWALNQARRGQVVILPSRSGDRVRALVQLDPVSDTFLYVGRLVDRQIFSYVQDAAGAAAAYQDLEQRRSGVEITFALIFVVVALLILFTSVWIALVFASHLVRPMGLLADAAERVRSGDLSVRVAEGPPGDEVGSLSRAFNRMTSQLQSQRRELIDANAQLDQRRRFTELVLSGVSAGVVGVDREGRIELPNRSACELLSVDLTAHVGERLQDLVPEMADLLDEALADPQRPVEAQINIERGGQTRNLLLRVSAGRGEGEGDRFVITFDDVTELLGAQRKAAWADVARRIAHEIKNPLTPIQLSAERLKRKYLRQIVDDPATFQVCTDTIVRQVGDIGRMVDEFSAFARMPTPVMQHENIVELCRQSLFLQQSAHPQITYHVNLPQTSLLLACDATLVGRALTNLLQNAADAIDGRLSDQPSGPAGEIWLTLGFEKGEAFILIEDNGRGLPKVERYRLTEPYVTTRAKGTGLGLAIVKKIMEDHGGNLILDDRPGGGASVRLIFVNRPAAMEEVAAAGARTRLFKAHGA
jgi:two-component system nitrogen regulation sensor histidine kinase NtrY